MSGRLDPSVAAVRRAVRLSLGDLEPGQVVLAACSGGADSMALTAAAVFEGAKAGWLVGAVVVDHGLAGESAQVAAAVADRLATCVPFQGLDPVEVVAVSVGSAGGPEGAARAARYAALGTAAATRDAVVLLGHTLDDQAETVLLGLGRGSGLRSLAGMRHVHGPYRRPLLELTRAQTRQACAALALPVWHDPANDDLRFARVRVRRNVLPVLEDQLGPGVAEALARTADLATADADALDAIAGELATLAGLGTAAGPAAATEGAVSLDVRRLAPAPRAVRTRVLRLAALAAGCPGGELFAVHLGSVDALVTGWHGQRGVDLPGHLTATRHGGTLTFSAKVP
jgi:tRNA(Ile)-lysidine synthase